MHNKLTFFLKTFIVFPLLTFIFFAVNGQASETETNTEELTRQQRAIAANRKIYSKDVIQAHLRKPESVFYDCKEETITKTVSGFSHAPHFYGIEPELIKTLTHYVRKNEPRTKTSLPKKRFRTQKTPIRILDLSPGKSSTLETILSSGVLETKPFTYVAVSDHPETLRKTKEVWTESNTFRHISSQLINIDQNPLQFLIASQGNKSQKFDIVISLFGFSCLQPQNYIKALMCCQTLLHNQGHLFTTQPSYRGDCYPEEYIEALMNTTKIPFWNTDKQFTSDCMTTGRLMAGLGFQTLHTELSAQHYSKQKKWFYYLATHVQKKHEVKDFHKKLADYGIL